MAAAANRSCFGRLVRLKTELNVAEEKYKRIAGGASIDVLLVRRETVDLPSDFRKKENMAKDDDRSALGWTVGIANRVGEGMRKSAAGSCLQGREIRMEKRP